MRSSFPTKEISHNLLSVCGFVRGLIEKEVPELPAKKLLCPLESSRVKVKA